MTTISVFPEPTNPPARLYRAIAGEREAVWPTIGDAVKAVTDQMGDPQETTLIVVQPMQPDRFFNAEQMNRLRELMTKWRAALNSGTKLPPDELAELDDLVQAEFAAMIERSKALASQLPP